MVGYISQDELDDFFSDSNSNQPVKVDMMNKKCTCCKDGIFIKKYLQDDRSGVLHCHICDKEIVRYILLEEYRNFQINKILS